MNEDILKSIINNYKTPTYVFDINKSKCCVGLIPETFRNIKEVVDSKISVLKKELELIDNQEEYLIETNEDLIKEIIVNLKSNFIKLNNHEKKMFLERFVKEIRVKKEGDEVMIESVLF